MAQFLYKALDKNGQSTAGALAAASEKDAISILSRRGLAPYHLAISARQTHSRLVNEKKIRRKDLARFLRQFATLLKAGVTLPEALATLARSSAHSGLTKKTGLMQRDLRAGKRLSTCLSAHLPELPLYAVRLAELGEATGALAPALSDAADRMEYELELDSEVRSALTYPIFLGVVGSLVIVLLFVFVVPRFDALLGENRESIPWISRAVIGFGVSLQTNWPFLAAGLCAAIMAAAAGMQNKNFREWLYRQFERMPLVGNFLIGAEIGIWCRTVGIALQNKAQLIMALELGESGCRSRRLRSNLEIVRREVRSGQPLDVALAQAEPRIDPLVIDLIRTGRDAGALSEMLLFAAATFEKASKERAKQITTLVEPIAILLISLVVATIVLSIVMAMTSLYDFAI